MIEKKLLFIEINEADFNFFLKGARKYNFSEITNFFKKKKKFHTFTHDKEEGYNLDPWVQWVSVHTGKNSKVHKILRLGQTLNKKIKQTWDILAKKRISSFVFGAFNASYRKNKFIKIFLPDPWSFNEFPYPKILNKIHELPSYYSQNYPKIETKIILVKGIKFLSFIIFQKRILFFFLKNIFQLIKIIFYSKFRSFILYFLLDLIYLFILNNKLKKNDVNFAIVTLNSFAHYQHNHWDEKKYEFIYFWFLNEIIKIFNIISINFNETLVYNGFNQYKIKPIYTLRPKKPDEFIKKIGIKFKSVRQNMTTGATIFFNNQKEKMNAIKIMREFNIFSYPIFNIEDYKKNLKIFYKFAIETKIDELKVKYLNKKNYKKFINLNNTNQLKKKSLNVNKIELLLNEVIYTKSTSKHKSSGTLFTDNLDFKKTLIENTKIHNKIINFFS